MNKHGFEDALAFIKDGEKAYRKGWNGKDMWVRLTKHHRPMSMTTYKQLDYIEMKTADDSIVPWLASQTDILANDWEMV